ncbi:MAG TPA: GNAT family N-acetyltransferase, partial [Ilumatobacteraceae bacterium]
MISLPLATDRLSIVMMRAEHAGTLAAYRSDPEVARYQEWEIPFTLEMAHRLIAGQSHVDGPVDDTWVQLAVQHGHEVVGDVAVGIHDSERQANIGYSIKSSAQGNGYATEA